jgi:hypothetical protein
MKSSIIFRIIAILSFIFGIILFTSAKVSSLGQVIGTSNLTQITTILFSAFFLIMGGTLFLIEMKK